jgi:hypothetical protein
VGGKNRRRGLGPKVAGAAVGVGEQHGLVGELTDAAAVPDGNRSDLPSVRQQRLRVAPNSGLRQRSVLGAEVRYCLA